MRAGASALLLLFATGIAQAAGPRFSMDFGVGGGYEDNLNHAPNGANKKGGGVAESWLQLGGSKDVLGAASVSLFGAFQGELNSTYSDLSATGLNLRGGLTYPVNDETELHITAPVGLYYYGATNRDATRWGAAVSMREQLKPRLAATVEYAYTQNDADQEVFSFNENKFTVTGEAKPAGGSRATLSYAAAFGQSVFYEDSSLPDLPGTRAKALSSTFAADQEALKVNSTAHTATIAWDQEFGRGVHARAACAFSYVVSEAGVYRDQAVSGQIGYRF